MTKPKICCNIEMKKRYGKLVYPVYTGDKAVYYWTCSECECVRIK